MSIVKRPNGQIRPMYKKRFLQSANNEYIAEILVANLSHKNSLFLYKLGL